MARGICAPTFRLLVSDDLWAVGMVQSKHEILGRGRGLMSPRATQNKGGDGRSAIFSPAPLLDFLRFIFQVNSLEFSMFLNATLPLKEAQL